MTEALLLMEAGLAVLAFLGVTLERVTAWRHYRDRRSVRELLLATILLGAASSGAVGTLFLLPYFSDVATASLGILAWGAMALAGVALATGWAE